MITILTSPVIAFMLRKKVASIPIKQQPRYGWLLRRYWLPPDFNASFKRG